MGQLIGLVLLGAVFSLAAYLLVVFLRNRRILPFLPPLNSNQKKKGIWLGLLIGTLSAFLTIMGSWNLYGVVGLSLVLVWASLILFGSFWLYRLWKPAPQYDFLDWPLAAVSLLSLEKKWATTSLSPLAFTSRNQQKARKYLLHEWEISGTEEWQEVCEWLVETGQRKQFHREIDKVLSWDEGELAAYLTEIDEGKAETEDGATAHELHARIHWVVDEGFQLLEQSFLAWDLLRMIDLCRWAYLAAWADEEAVTAYLFLAGQALQKRYRHWEELNDAYLNGLRYWSYDAYKQGKKRREKHLSFLRTHKSSPWKRIPWRFELPTPDFGGEAPEEP